MLFLPEYIAYKYKKLPKIQYFIYLMKKQGAITKQEVPKILQFHFPEYKADKVKMEATFGMTNETYKITAEGQHPVIFRILSPVIDRKFENKVLEKLDAKKICPKTLFSSQKYRIEQFIQDAKHPSTQDINNDEKLLANILKTAYQLHEVKLPNDLKKKFFNDVVFTEKSRAKYTKATCTEKGKQKQFEELKQNLIKQFDKLKEETQQEFTKGKHPVRLCHNDINNNNIFVKKINGEQDILFIDFQYACLNYVAYDIANLMNECCFDYNDDEDPGFKVYKKVTEEEIKKVCSLYPGNYKGMQEDIKIMLKMANFFWALWSLLVQKNGNEHFSPTQHGKCRWELYKYYDSKYDK